MRDLMANKVAVKETRSVNDRRNFEDIDKDRDLIQTHRGPRHTIAKPPHLQPGVPPK